MHIKTMHPLKILPLKDTRTLQLHLHTSTLKHFVYFPARNCLVNNVDKLENSLFLCTTD